MPNNRDRDHIEELLRDPFGPYRDEEVLSAECQSKQGQTLVLNSFQLAYNDEIIGLDESEQPLGTGEVDARQYRFRGILSIRFPFWLSQVGVKRVEAELNSRALTRSMREGQRPLPAITLEELFRLKNKYLGRTLVSGDNEELELRLKIQGFKNFPALYMMSKQVPHGLFWNSKDCGRSYEVATMDISTFQRSENFFWRYRLLALMTKIVGEARTPVEKRTPEWFVSQYIERFAHPASDEHERLIYDSDDSDIDEGKTRLPRYPRRVHRRDVLGLFAAQSEWFITDNEVKRNRIFPFKSWNQFRKEVRKARWKAARNNVIWGWPIGREHDPDLESDPDNDEGEEEEDDEDTRNVVMQNPIIGKPNEVVRRKIDKAKNKSTLPSARRAESISSSSSSDDLDPARAHAYMSDFSGESSVAASDSSDESVDARLPEFGELIPHQLSQVPELPGPDNRWWCPVPDCGHMIDLQHLTGDDIKALPGPTVFYLMQKKWQSIREDERAKQCFFETVSQHYGDHFADLGLTFVHTREKTGIDRIRGKRREQAVVTVKEEVT